MSTQRPRRNPSPRSASGPIRATLPFSLTHAGSPTRGISSSNGRRTSPGPTSSPTQPVWPSNDGTHKGKHRRSPDLRTSPESGVKVERPKAVHASPGPQIRRTSSLDTITAPYLSGQWPRAEISSSHSSSSPYGPNQIHQSTQTEDLDRCSSSHKRSSSWGSADNLKEKYKQHLRKQGRQSSSSNQRASPVHGNHATVSCPPPISPSLQGTPSGTPTTRSMAIPVPTSSLKPPSPRIRGSVEGLNQEIEKLVLHGMVEEAERTQEPLPDGHRAPIPGVTTRRSVDTQTPGDNQEDSSNSEENGSRSHSVSPTFVMDGSRPSSRSSSTGNGDISKETKVVDAPCSPELQWGPKYASSPSHNKSCQLTRDPPDGCEKVKTIDEPSPTHKSVDSGYNCPDKKMYFQLKPSDSSAFCPLPNFPPGEFKTLITSMSVAQTQTEAQTQTQVIGTSIRNGIKE